MSDDTPAPVSHYLQSILHKGNAFGYLQLDDRNRVVGMGGDLSLFGPTKIDINLSIDEQVPALSGLLPVVDQPVVIANTHADDSQFADLHLYLDEGSQWVIFIDTTAEATQLQNNQQTRLSRDIIKERNTNH